MPNLMTNAGFLDGTSGWSVTGPLTVAVDETVRGDPGRAVLVASGATTTTNQTMALAPTTAARPVVVPGQNIELNAYALALVNGGEVTPTARLNLLTAGGAQVQSVTLAPQAAPFAALGLGVMGLRGTFRRLFHQMVVPATAVRAELVVSHAPAASGAAVVLALLKPQLAVRPAGRTEPMSFEPGLHASVDLQRDAWPLDLQPFDLGPGGERQPDRVEFQAGASAPQQRRRASDPVRKFSGQLRCDPVQRATLEAFWRTASAFWIVEPDSDRLCVGRFAADGAPRMVEDLGVECRMAVDLWLETA